MYRSLLAECNYIHWDNPLEDQKHVHRYGPATRAAGHLSVATGEFGSATWGRIDRQKDLFPGDLVGLH